MNWEAMFPGKYVKSSEFAGKKPTLTIAGVTIEDLPDDKGGNKKRGVMTFKETPKALVLNRTNATAIKAMFGAETDNWRGKRVTLWAAPFTDPFTGEQITAVRVLGSPDIDEAKNFQAKIGRKQVAFRLAKTGNGKGAAKKSEAPPEPPPSLDESQSSQPPDDMELPTF